MEHATQQASGVMNPLASWTKHNTQECNTNIASPQQANHPFESGTTNPLTSSEFIAVQKRQKEWWARYKKGNTGNLCESGPISGSTDALSTSGIKAINKREQSGTQYQRKKASDGSHALNRDLLQQGEASEHGSPIGDKATQSSHASEESIVTDKTVGSMQVGPFERCRPDIKRATLTLNTKSLKEVNVQALGSVLTDTTFTAKEELVLTQSQYTYGFKLQLSSTYQNQKGRS
ncbi:hypothetical protein ACHAQJ_003439 [Trichoderma viride]